MSKETCSQEDRFLTGHTPHGVLMSPVTGNRGLSTLNSFLCPFDDDPELLSATSDISAFPSKTNVFKIVSISPSDSCTYNHTESINNVVLVTCKLSVI